MSESVPITVLPEEVTYPLSLVNIEMLPETFCNTLLESNTVVPAPVPLAGLTASPDLNINSPSAKTLSAV